MATEKKAKRIRRTAEEAKLVILDAAEKRLREHGPAGIKLQELAADVGVSHPAILHHFGSRDGLVEAVVKRSLDVLRGRLLDELRNQLSREVNVPVILDSVFAIVAESGNARLIAWLMLDGSNARDETRMMRTLSEAGHVRMVAGGWTEGREFTFDDMMFVVMLVGSAAIGMGVVGEAMRHSMGVEDDPTVDDRFRRWLAALVARYLSGQGELAGIGRDANGDSKSASE